MSLSDEEILRLNRILHDLEEGMLSSDEVQNLENWLKSSEDARRYYVQRRMLISGLMRMSDEAQLDGVNHFWEKQETVYKFLIIGGIGLVFAFIAFLSFEWDKGARRNFVDIDVEHSDAGCAILMEVVDVEWDGGEGVVGAPLSKGRLALRAGLARLEFYSGASMTLEAPCEVELLGVDEARCLRGRVRVRVSPHARGFRLHAPDARLVDLGTEFGVMVDEGGRSEVHVFEGEVDVYPGLKGDGGRINLTSGRLWSLSTGEIEEGARRGEFVDGRGLRSRSRAYSEHRVKKWREKMKQIEEDKRVIVCYLFENDVEEDRTLRNGGFQATEATHGSVVGARWTEGRWPGKRALQFKSPGDRVRVSVDGEYSAITLCAWVSVDGYDRRYSSLFLTDGFQVGNPHWQLQRDGGLVFGVKSKGEDKFQHVFRSPPVFQSNNLGVWIHLATTFDFRSGIGRHYVNGRLVIEHEEKDIPEGSMMRFGMAELGNWGLPSKVEESMEVRSFNGKMDEFLLFREALSPDEIRNLYEVGRPD